MKHRFLGWLAASLFGFSAAAHAATTQAAVQLYFFQGTHNQTLISADPAEVYKIRNTMANEWTFENFGSLYVFAEPGLGLEPLYRYRSPKTGDYFFTIDPNEGPLAVKDLGYVSEGICCYVLVTGNTGLERNLVGA